MMFAPNCVGTANATTAGWGNLGGGVTQMVMPLIFSAFLMLGIGKFVGWRLAMIVPGAVLFVTVIAYYFFTQDAPDGNYRDLRAQGRMAPRSDKSYGSFLGASSLTLCVRFSPEVEAAEEAALAEALARREAALSPAA